MSLNLKLLLDIWCFRNSVLHGSTQKEQHIMERERVNQQVKTIYQSPIKLSTRFTPVNALPLDIRLRSSTLTLQRWVSRIQHQKQLHYACKVLFGPDNYLPPRHSLGSVLIFAISTHRNHGFEFDDVVASSRYLQLSCLGVCCFLIAVSKSVKLCKINKYYIPMIYL
jgi:hypothetical protein